MRPTTHHCRTTALAASVAFAAGILANDVGAVEPVRTLTYPHSLAIRRAESADSYVVFSGTIVVTGTLVGQWLDYSHDPAHEPDADATLHLEYTLVPDDPKASSLPHYHFRGNEGRWDYPIESVDIDNPVEALAEAAGPDATLRLQQHRLQRLTVHARFHLDRVETSFACDHQSLWGHVRRAERADRVTETAVESSPGC